MSAKDQHEFRISVKKWVTGLAAPEKHKAKKLLKRYVCAFTTNKKRQGRTAMVKHKIDTGKAKPIKQALRSIGDTLHTLDLQSAYMDKEKTAFSANGGLWQFMAI